MITLNISKKNQIEKQKFVLKLPNQPKENVVKLKIIIIQQTKAQ